jgi:hemoglobin/transferrin/lactoferrin receptor protein
MKYTLLLCLLWCIADLSYAQVITLRDSETQKPIESAILISEQPSASTTTNSLGEADITAFAGATLIVITAFGFESTAVTYDELNSNATFQLQPSNFTMEEVVISATKWNQPLRDLPVKITSLSAREIAFQNPQTAADMLGTSGEVFVQKSQQGGGSPMIRGFSTNRLLYVIDGVRMNTAIFRGGNLQNVISLDPFATEKTEVLFGPGSVIYGSDAIGGVMNFQTLQPQYALSGDMLSSGKAIARYATANNEKTAHFDALVGWKKWALVSSISSWDFDDLRMGSYGPEEYLRPFYVQRIDSVDVVVTNDDTRIQRPSGYSQMNFMQKVGFKPNDSWEFNYGFHYSETSDYSRYDRHVRYRQGLPRYGEWYYGPQKWMMNNLSATHTGANAFYTNMTLRVAMQNFEESRIDRNMNEAERHIRIEKVNALSANLDFSKSIGALNHLFYGLELVTNDVESVGEDENIVEGSTAPGPARYPQAEWASYAAYVTYQWNPLEQFHVMGGIRYNTFSLNADFDTTFYPFPYTHAEISNGAITGSLGAAFRSESNFTASANLSTGFRSPNVDDAGKVFDSEPGSVIVPNPDLKPEYAYNAELSIGKIVGERLKFDVTGYYTRLEDALVRRNFTLNGMDSILYDGELSQVQAIQNGAVATVYGVQAGFELQIAKGLELESKLNYQHGEEELDDGTTSPSRHAPPMFGMTRLSYSMDKVQLQLYGIYSGKKDFDELPEEEKAKGEIYASDADGNPYSPSWYTLNFKAAYQVGELISIGAGLENLTDRRYRPYSSGIVAPGRNFMLSLTAKF